MRSNFLFGFGYVKIAKQALHQRAGFTIIEVVVTLAMIGALFVVFQASANTILINRRVKNEEIALRVVSTKAEEIRALTYETVPTSGAFVDPLLNSLQAGSATITVSDYDAATKEVVVSVSWQERGGETTRNVTLTTLVTQGGL
jgi:prepilin-type N-terminal cleavage/methylation domain-containing protein